MKIEAEHLCHDIEAAFADVPYPGDANILAKDWYRKEYDGFPGYPIHPLPRQIEAIEIVSGKPVVAITINHENIRSEEIPVVCRAVADETQLPAFDVLRDGAEGLVELLEAYRERMSHVPGSSAGESHDANRD